uniref:Uncharacterized protein n=1 Tax=Candidatus Kentrum sp. LFY TaxID=2126342 RepID=A0A450ULZ4_9GAMM|nr:MAG: hypothetical protein BECKLFY1418B_GA0070995_104717 [Candidatus Kentron sp. LFY]
MKSLKTTIIAGALSATLAMPALASNTSVPRGAAQFTETDTQALFAQDVGPMELAMLSPEEMEATEGAWVWVVIRAGVILYSGYSAYRAWSTANQNSGNQNNIEINNYGSGTINITINNY